MFNALMQLHWWSGMSIIVVIGVLLIKATSLPVAIIAMSVMGLYIGFTVSAAQEEFRNLHEQAKKEKT